VTVKVPGAATRARRARLLGKVRFSLRGRYLIVRARAKRTGTLKVRIRKRKRKLGACTKRARANRPFRCRIKLRRRTSPAGGRAVVTLIRKGKAAAVDTYRVPRRLRR
jgi:hypothetical protein